MALDHLALSRSTLDKVGDDRQDPTLLGRVLDEAGTRYLVMRAGRTPLQGGGEDGLRLLDGRQVEVLGLHAAYAPGSALLVHLGRLRAMTDPGPAPALVAVLLGEGGLPVELLEVTGPIEDWADLRQVGAQLDDTEAGALTEATALGNWHVSHLHCPRCGAATTVGAAGHERRCPVDGTSQFPRHDPAVIMTVSDRAGRLLLGRQGRWPVGRYSAFAGFVEAGESLEQAVARELYEEAGVTVRELEYLGSQPWPFPASLMLAFHVETDDEIAVPDGCEIVETRWFERDTIEDLVRRGEVGLPGRVSVARRLVERWLGRQIEAPDTWR